MGNNRFGVIPKSTPGKWRLIVDLSYPKGQSANDGIRSSLSSMVYSSVADASKILCRLGPGALMAKVDIASAFRNIPVHPDDRHLLAMACKDHVYFDKQIPFGLCSAPILFNAYADALEWIIRSRGVGHILYYLDDFLIMGKADSVDCLNNLSSLLQTCEELGIPLAAEKLEGPITKLTFLGIELDSVQQVAHLPMDKLSKLKVELVRWSAKKSCTRGELEQFLCLLNFACLVIPPGLCFLHRMFDLLCIAKRKHHLFV